MTSPCEGGEGVLPMLTPMLKVEPVNYFAVVGLWIPSVGGADVPI